MDSNNSRNHTGKRVCFPVGCLHPASVSVTRCHYGDNSSLSGGGCSLCSGGGGGCRSLSGGVWGSVGNFKAGLNCNHMAGPIYGGELVNKNILVK